MLSFCQIYGFQYFLLFPKLPFYFVLLFHLILFCYKNNFLFFIIEAITVSFFVRDVTTVFQSADKKDQDRKFYSDLI